MRNEFQMNQTERRGHWLSAPLNLLLACKGRARRWLGEGGKVQGCVPRNTRTVSVESVKVLCLGFLYVMLELNLHKDDLLNMQMTSREEKGKDGDEVRFSTLFFAHSLLILRAIHCPPFAIQFLAVSLCSRRLLLRLPPQLNLAPDAATAAADDALLSSPSCLKRLLHV